MAGGIAFLFLRIFSSTALPVDWLGGLGNPVFLWRDDIWMGRQARWEHRLFFYMYLSWALFLRTTTPRVTVLLISEKQEGTYLPTYIADVLRVILYNHHTYSQDVSTKCLSVACSRHQ